MLYKPYYRKITVLACLLALGTPTLATAQDAVETQGKAAIIDILPAQTATEKGILVDETIATDPAIKMTPDKSELIKLSKKASAVIVGNSAHLSILPESATVLVLVPKTPGATYFSVLDEDKNVIMQRHVIVGAPQEKYVRVRKSCASGAKKDCQTTQVYYCPDMCHEIMVNSDQKTDAGAADALTSAGQTGQNKAATDPAAAGQQEQPAAPAEDTTTE